MSRIRKSIETESTLVVSALSGLMKYSGITPEWLHNLISVLRAPEMYTLNEFYSMLITYQQQQ